MNAIAIIVLIFFLLGALDHLIGNRFGIGKEFERGFLLFAPMSLSMLGMIVLAPMIGKLLTPLFDGDLVRAERTAAMCDRCYLEVTDVLEAPADRPAHVRWTMLTEGEPAVTPEGILLTRDSKTRTLRTEGGKVTYRVWSSNLDDYDDIFKEDGKPVEIPVEAGTYICGYEIEIPAGQKLTLTTTLK